MIVTSFVDAFADRLEQHRRRVEIVDGDVEEALDLPGVQVHAEDAVRAGGRDEVGDELRRDRRARTHLPVLPGVAVVGNHGRDAASGRALERVRHHQQLHQVVVGGSGSRLQDEDVLPADVLEELDAGLTVAEGPYLGLADLDAEVGGHVLREAGSRIARE